MKTLAEINKAIASITTSGAKLDKLIQTTAVAVLEHFAEHKDTGLVNRLYLAMPKGSRSTALASWLLAYCAVVPNTVPATKKEQPFAYAKDKKTDPVAGAQDMWYDHKPEKAVDEVFDLQKAIRGVLAKAAKAKTLTHASDAEWGALKAAAIAMGIPESDVPTRAKPADMPAAPM